MVRKIQLHPQPFQQGQDSIWQDPYIARQMLQQHLDPDGEGASRNHEFIQESVTWLTQHFPAKSFAQVLDLGCGPGLYTSPLARFGYQVSGIDFSKISIDYARQQAQEQKLTINYQLGNYLKMLEEGIGEKYQLILLIYCDIGMFSPRQRRELLQACLKHLQVGGSLVFDSFTPEKYHGFIPRSVWKHEPAGGFWSATDCLHLSVQQEVVPGETYLDQHDLLDSDGYLQKEFLIWETVTTPEKMKKELVEIGFSQVDFYANVAGDPYSANSETVAFVATKGGAD